jgi:hypothetical protein
VLFLGLAHNEKVFIKKGEFGTRPPVAWFCSARQHSSKALANVLIKFLKPLPIILLDSVEVLPQCLFNDKHPLCILLFIALY